MDDTAKPETPPEAPPETPRTPVKRRKDWDPANYGDRDETVPAPLRSPQKPDSE